MAEELRKKIMNWYSKNGRDFPWRHTLDPYKIMIAEFMLHRTKAEQVVPVYLEFIKEYPDIKSLVKAKSTIKYFTAHLGLHWRNRHFIESARYITNIYNNKFPENYDELRKIPGIGDYIAGAIMAVCFNKPAPVVDSNIARFINRYYGLNLDGELRRKQEVVKISQGLFKCRNPRLFLFAIVDFTSMICKPRIPICYRCPIRRSCKSKNGPSPNRTYIVPQSGLPKSVNPPLFLFSPYFQI